MSKYKKYSGFTLIEMMLVIAILSIALLASSKYEKLLSERNQAVAAGHQIKNIGMAVKSYLAYNLSTLDSESFVLKNIPMTDITAATSCGAAPCLTFYIKTTTYWGANFSIWIRKTGTATPYLYETLIITSTGTGPSAITVNGETRLDLASHAANTVGDQVAFTIVKSGAPVVVSSGGANLSYANWVGAVDPVGTNSIGGQLAYFISQVGLPLDAVYLRMDGSNKMLGNLNMGGKGIYGVGYGINNTGVTAAGSTSATNQIITDGIVVNGSTILNGNTTISSGNLTVANNGTFGSVTTNGALTVSGAATLNSSLSVSTTTTVSGDISTGGNVHLTSAAGDVKMAGLLSNHTTDSLKDLAPNLVEVASFNVGDGSGVSSPACGAGGSPRIFVIPSSAVAPIYGGSVGYIFSASGPAGGPWVVNAKDSAGNPLPGSSIALARTFCAF